MFDNEFNLSQLKAIGERVAVLDDPKESYLSFPILVLLGIVRDLSVEVERLRKEIE